MLDGLPTDEELSQFSGPSEAFDYYAESKNGGQTLNKGVRDRINEHMEDRGLSKTIWQGTHEDIPPGGMALDD